MPSLFSVFFIDRNQRVTFNDAGTIDKIRNFAQEQNSLIYEGVLESQFRCNGSDGYLAWLDNVLQLQFEVRSFSLYGRCHYFGIML